MFVRVHCSAEKSEKSILRHLFSEEAPNPAPPLEEGPIFESPKQKTGTEKAYPYKHFFRHRRRTNIYRRPVLRPTRTNICRVSWAKHFAGQTFFRGGGGPLLAAARAPPDVCTSNVCTGLPLAEEGRCWDREMFVRVGCTRPVQTFAHKLGAPDPYKHSDEFRGPNICPKSLPVQTSRPKRVSGPKKCLYGSALRRRGRPVQTSARKWARKAYPYKHFRAKIGSRNKQKFVRVHFSNVCTGKPLAQGRRGPNILF